MPRRGRDRKEVTLSVLWVFKSQIYYLVKTFEETKRKRPYENKEAILRKARDKKRPWVSGSSKRVEDEQRICSWACPPFSGATCTPTHPSVPVFTHQENGTRRH